MAYSTQNKWIQNDAFVKFHLRIIYEHIVSSLVHNITLELTYVDYRTQTIVGNTGLEPGSNRAFPTTAYETKDYRHNSLSFIHSSFRLAPSPSSTLPTVQAARPAHYASLMTATPSSQEEVCLPHPPTHSLAIACLYICTTLCITENQFC